SGGAAIEIINAKIDADGGSAIVGTAVTLRGAEISSANLTGSLAVIDANEVTIAAAVPAKLSAVTLTGSSVPSTAVGIRSNTNVTINAPCSVYVSGSATAVDAGADFNNTVSGNVKIISNSGSAVIAGGAVAINNERAKIIANNAGTTNITGRTINA